MTSEVLILEPSFAHALLVSMFLNIFVVHNNTIGLRHVSTLDDTFDEGDFGWLVWTVSETNSMQFRKFTH